MLPGGGFGSSVVPFRVALGTDCRPWVAVSVSGAVRLPVGLPRPNSVGLVGLAGSGFRLGGRCPLGLLRQAGCGRLWSTPVGPWLCGPWLGALLRGGPSAVQAGPLGTGRSGRGSLAGTSVSCAALCFLAHAGGWALAPAVGGLRGRLLWPGLMGCPEQRLVPPVGEGPVARAPPFITNDSLWWCTLSKRS